MVLKSVSCPCRAGIPDGFCLLLDADKWQAALVMRMFGCVWTLFGILCEYWKCSSYFRRMFGRFNYRR